MAQRKNPNQEKIEQINNNTSPEEVPSIGSFIPLIIAENWINRTEMREQLAAEYIIGEKLTKWRNEIWKQKAGMR